MLSSLCIFAVLSLSVLTFAAPPSLQKRLDTTTYCGQWDTVVEGRYTLYLNQWGLSDATSGHDCAALVSLSGTKLAWTTEWNWQGGNSVKSYTNVNLNEGIDKQLSDISSIPAKWTWVQSSESSDIVANVAWDLFTSTTAGGSNQNAFEIMIWMANYNAGPISYNYGADGQPVPIASDLHFAGRTWNLYYGYNGWNYVYSFLPTSGIVTSFQADINMFLNYLSTSQELPSVHYLTTLQGGTEATRGSAVLDSFTFDVRVN